MAEDAAILRMKKDKAEKDYDAAVTALNRCQAQLSSKAAQSQKLPMDEYRKWLADKKQEQTTLMAELQVLKKGRAEARRQFNCWKPEVKETWLDAPDDPGWWWHYDAKLSDLGMFSVTEDGDKDLMIFYEDDWHTHEELLERAQLVGKWKYQEEPELP